MSQSYMETTDFIRKVLEQDGITNRELGELRLREEKERMMEEKSTTITNERLTILREAESQSFGEGPEEEAPEKSPLFARKNSMRNKACPCGSGKKFKKCCWNKFNKATL